MKATKLIVTPLLATVLVSLAPLATIAHADTAGTYGTTGQVTFVPSTDSSVTPPVDPTNPDPNTPVVPVDPTDPTKPVTPGTAGPLSIDYVSSFNFGTQEITTKDMTYYASAQKFNGSDTSKPLYAQVTDNRGTDAGWSLTANASNFSNGSGTSEKVLTGAQISLANAGLETSTSSNALPPKASNTTLTPGTAVTVASASNGQGAGTWANSWGKDADLTSVTDTNGDTRDGDKAVSLSVPEGGNAKAQKYTSDITWTLSDTPAN
ncbi:WxL domain-containing protein [Periweissella cryptocerci]|uniref:WxL domain-containing protein n=1 Tax=Periweissella cryptocerci TaxID=2506420 RepID=A0A4P6YQZ4_9LACO|nr:WxL domain-containing protein [Periweissella cryptocerci]QBO35037.1 WxL domain-containing protein [Periweissella cryptocerci]